jgi:uncharacterized protein (TIGR02246 family)
MSRPSILFHSALVLLIGLTAASSRADDVRKAVDAGNAAFRTAFLAGDAQKVSELYTADAEVTPPGAPIARGRAAIAAFWKGGMAGIKDLSLETRAVESSGDLAVEDGNVKLTAPDGAVSTSRYIVVWKRDAGTWKLHRDIWNAEK